MLAPPKGNGNNPFRGRVYIRCEPNSNWAHEPRASPSLLKDLGEAHGFHWHSQRPGFDRARAFPPKAASRRFAGRTASGKGTGSRMSPRRRPSAATPRWSSASTMPAERTWSGRAQCGAPGAGAARGRVAGRAAPRHPECRRLARARRLEAAGPHARRADPRLVPVLRSASALARTDERRRLPVMRRGGQRPPGHRVVRRNALRNGAHRRGAAAVRPVRLGRHVGRGLSGGRVRPDGALLSALGRSS